MTGKQEIKESKKKINTFIHNFYTTKIYEPVILEEYTKYLHPNVITKYIIEDDSAFPLICEAALEGNIKIVKLYLKHYPKDKMNSWKYRDCSVLGYGIGNLDIVKLFIKSKKINLMSKTQGTYDIIDKLFTPKIAKLLLKECINRKHLTWFNKFKKNIKRFHFENTNYKQSGDFKKLIKYKLYTISSYYLKN